jgi:hypothetical protein
VTEKMNKYLLLITMSGIITLCAMDQDDDDFIKEEKQEDFIQSETGNIGASGENLSQEQRNRDNQQVISSLNEAWKYLYAINPNEREFYFKMIDQVLDDQILITFSNPALNQACRLIKAQDSNRKKCWRDVIKISWMKNVIIEGLEKNITCSLFSKDLQTYVNDQISGNYGPDEQLDDWLNDMLWLYSIKDLLNVVK